MRWGSIRQSSVTAKRATPRAVSTWARDASNSENLVQSYRSTTRDPFLNLSIEHYLLQKTPPKSVVLFLYINRPCVVIGRNQNPWLEVNLQALHDSPATSPLGNVDLVRRRSGGGAVFHDNGNVNWTVISPSDSFTRDKHAEMVVRALRSHGVERARVNERHDIVLDQGPRHGHSNKDDLHRTSYTSDAPTVRPLKVSGSAYKLTRGRALHHGTCLLESPNLRSISRLLHSPGRNFIRAKGVESVSSPVSNIGLGTEVFKEAVRAQFAQMYSASKLAATEVGDDAIDVAEVAKGYDELLTPAWLWDQTPGFTLSSTPIDGGDGNSPASDNLPPSTNINLEVKHGKIIDCLLSTSNAQQVAEEEAKRFRNIVIDRRLRDPWIWADVVQQANLDIDAGGEDQLTNWLETMIPRIDVTPTHLN